MEELDEKILSLRQGNRYTNLAYLVKVTGGSVDSIKEMIQIYLNQTPGFARSLREGIRSGDWESVKSAAHSLIPSFTVMGIDTYYESIARKIQENAIKKKDQERTCKLIEAISHVCDIACQELEEELARLNLT
jgi:HPt (histidine-containing phosphotransfer) domain-containing protein